MIEPFYHLLVNIIANSYLPVTTELMIKVIAINIDKTPKSSGEYIRVKIGEIAIGMA